MTAEARGGRPGGRPYAWQRAASAALLLLACSLPWDLRVPYLNLGFMTVTTGKAALLVAALVGYAGLVWGRSPSEIGPPPWWRADNFAWITAGLYLVSALVTPGDVHGPLKMTGRVFLWVGVYLCASRTRWTSPAYRRLAVAFSCSAGCAAGLGLLDILTRRGSGWEVFSWFGVTPVSLHHEIVPRASGTFLDPTALAIVLAGVFPWLWLGLSSPHWAFIASTALSFTMLLTQWRLGPAILALQVLVMAISGNRRWPPVTGGLILALVCGLAFSDAVRSRWGLSSTVIPGDVFQFTLPPPPVSPGHDAGYTFHLFRPLDQAGSPEPRALLRITQSDRIIHEAQVILPNLLPGEGAQVHAVIPVPREPGQYRVEFVFDPAPNEFVPWLTLEVGLGTARWMREPRTGSPPIVASPDPERWRFWQAALNLLKQSPWLGLGPNRFRDRWTEVIADSGPDRRHSPYNLVLEAAVDCGAVGAASFLVFLYLVTRASLAHLSATPAALGWIAVLLAGMAESLFQSNALLSLFSLTAGLAVATPCRND